MTSATDALIAWARSNGAQLHSSLAVRHGTRGRGIFATDPIIKSSLLVRIPTALKVAPTGRLAELVASKEISHLLALALTALHGLHVETPQSPFYADLASQPPPRLPFFWPAAHTKNLRMLSENRSSRAEKL